MAINQGTTVTLSAFPSTGHVFVGWSGACTGTGGCSVTMTEARTITAQFSVPKRAFVTSTLHHGNLGGLAGADNICNTRATEAGIGGTWRALLSTNVASARSRIGHNWPSLTNMHGQVIALNEADLWDGFIGAFININERGTQIIPVTIVHTGTLVNGATNPSNCENFTSSTTPSIGSVGRQDRINGEWVAFGHFCCSTLGALYCIEQ